MHSVNGMARSAWLGLWLLGGMGASQAAELLVNGSFEQNSGAGAQGLTGWQAASQPGSQGGFYAQQGTRGAITPVTVPAPPDGGFALMSDQPGPGGHVLYQDITLAAGQPAALSGKVYVQNAAKLAASPATLSHALEAPNQQVRIDILEPGADPFSVGAGVLANVFQWPVETLDGPSSSGSGYQPLQFDLSAYAGRTVRLRIAQVDNRQSLFLGVDALSVWSGTVPTALAAPASPRFFAQGQSVTLTSPPVASIPGQTVTSYEAQCVPQGGGAVVTQTSSQPTVVVTGLTPGVDYSCTIAAKSSSGTGPSSAPTAVVSAPASGATVSALQGGAVSLIVANPASGCTLQSASVIAAQGVGQPPPQGAASYPLGVLDLKAADCTAGATMQLKVTMPQPIPQGAQYWKYGPTADNPAPHWYAFGTGGFALVPGEPRSYTLSIKDGGLGDDDLQENGKVSDPGGIMVMAAAGPATAIPVLDAWGLAGLSAFMLLAMAALRRRGAAR